MPTFVFKCFLSLCSGCLVISYQWSSRDVRNRNERKWRGVSTRPVPGFTYLTATFEPWKYAVSMEPNAPTSSCVPPSIACASTATGWILQQDTGLLLQEYFSLARISCAIVCKQPREECRKFQGEATKKPHMFSKSSKSLRSCVPLPLAHLFAFSKAFLSMLAATSLVQRSSRTPPRAPNIDMSKVHTRVNKNISSTVGNATQRGTLMYRFYLELSLHWFIINNLNNQKKPSVSPFTLANFSFVNLVFIFRFSSSTTNPVFARRVNLLVCSLPLHRHSYIGFILDFASSIHNKQRVYEERTSLSL
jgi:hypothetical protein